MPTRLVHLVVDAAQPAVLARFWAAALDWEVAAEEGDEVDVWPRGYSYPDPVALPLVFVPVSGAKTTKNRVHLDLATESAEHQAAECYRLHYVQLAERLTTALPGAHEALAAVRAAGERVVIITAKHPVSVEPSLRAVGISADEIFTLVHGPEKAAVLRSLKAAAYVGDTPPDMAAAVQAGVRAVGVATGSFTGPDLAAAGADVVLDSLTGFPAWYRSAF
jgi:phosphoglycolate phosphatase-like HAD superfamily hydrolase